MVSNWFAEEAAMAKQVVATAPPARRRTMSYEAWLGWAGASTQSEWVDGEVIEFMPPDTLHQCLVWFLAFLLGWYARARRLGELFLSPFEMRLRPGHVSREPDLLFVARDRFDRLDEKRLDGPADLAIELISDDSVVRDRSDKFDEYQQAGVREYWIFDARPGRRHRADFFRLNAAGAYEPALPDADGRYHSSAVPGFWLRPDWLWQDPLPDPLPLLAEIAPAAVREALRPALADAAPASGDDA
jgi:Uma2 family endonuclease